MKTSHIILILLTIGTLICSIIATISYCYNQYLDRMHQHYRWEEGTISTNPTPGKWIPLEKENGR